MSVIVPEQFIACVGISCFRALWRIHLPYDNRVVIEQIHVKVTVAVKVEEGGVRRISGIIQSKFGCFLGEREIGVVDEELFLLFLGSPFPEKQT